jgi:hypothetical protein
MSGRTSSLEDRVSLAIAVVVGGIGGAVGFTHSRDWAQANGQTEWIAWAVAVVIECMAIVASLELRRRRGAFAVCVLVASFLMQMAAQVASAPPTVAGWLIAATPSLGFLLIVKMLLGRLGDKSAAVSADLVPVDAPEAVVPAQAVRVDEPVAELPAPEPVRAEAVTPPATPPASVRTSTPPASPTVFNGWK